jgi:hypothetical protein
VRNAGARAAQGDVLFFVDADTRVPRGTVTAALAALQRGAVGGGATLRFEGDVPFWAPAMAAMVTVPMGFLRWAAGCFVFARKADFEAVGGFDPAFFASEEIHLSRALKRRGPFVIVSPAVMTSGRKTRLFSPLQLLGQLVKVMATGGRALRDRKSLGLWYEERRETGEKRRGEKPD